MNAALLFSRVLARLSILPVALSLVLAWTSGSAAAHGGEDHGAATSATISSPMVPRAYAQTEEFELVTQLQGRTLTITLDRFATNSPVPDAQIEVESGAVWRVQAQQVAPGVYTAPADALATPGKYPLSISVQTDDAADLLATTLEIEAPTQTLAPGQGWRPWLIGAMTSVVIASGLALLAVRRRHRAPSHAHEIGR